MLHIMHVVVPSAHKLSSTKLENSPTELLASTYICMHGQIWVHILLAALLLEHNYL